MRLFLTLSLTLILALPACALAANDAPLESQDALHTQTSAFMARVRANNIETAYQLLRPYLGVATAPYDQSARDAVDYFKRVTERVGQPLASSHVRTETIGNDFYRETWLQKFNTAAIAWSFTFYRPQDSWKLVGISHTTDIESLYHSDQ
ncbi:hypothetical protein [Marinobacter sp. SS21]|uniref:hypothetical protein n=1 Tax=Marinobacter sp. SS21 TaxID=2979460 RepID=UPI00232E0CD9|nr:hypothetical protein [Marinobacter sp. SS21]MDC0663699.1 hypothetical protein [Marinobacter sp. SS21]